MARTDGPLLLKHVLSVQMEGRLAWRTFACLPKDKTLSAWDGWNRCLKSACFCPGLRWSVCRHGLLRSRYRYSRHRPGPWQSVLRRIAEEPSTEENGVDVLADITSHQHACVIGITRIETFSFLIGVSVGSFEYGRVKNFRNSNLVGW